MGIEVCKYYKIFLGKTIFGIKLLNTSEANLKIWQDWPLLGSNISPKNALERQFKFQKYFLLYYLLTTFHLEGFRSTNLIKQKWLQSLPC